MCHSGAEIWNERQGRGMFPPYLRTWTQTAKWSTRKRRSYVIPSSGETDKPKVKCKEKRGGRSQALEGNEVMAGRNGNPVKQWLGIGTANR